MIKRLDIATKGWSDYRLIDSGEGRKLERFAGVVVDRPDPQALWKKENPGAWDDAEATFSRGSGASDAGNGTWSLRKGGHESWTLPFESASFLLSLGKFKHLGIFPEHESQWRELIELCQREQGIRVLNLFGYTGAASIVAAMHGAQVTHVDASKQTIAVMKENMARSGLPANAIRTVCEDAPKYAKRLVQREERFDVIVMDPPAFGRGPKGEVWKIEEKLPEFLMLLPRLLSQEARLVILNGYAAGYSARAFGELLSDALTERGGSISYGDVAIVQENSQRVLPTGIYATWRA